MKLAALDVMSEVFTRPYARGLERMDFAFGATNANGTTSVNNYDFQDYLTLYGRPPESPRYLIVPWFSPPRDLDVTFLFRHAGQGYSSTVSLPAGTKPGLSIAIPFPSGIDPHLSVMPDVRLTQFQPAPDPPLGNASDSWSIFVVMGNIAKLLWVLGGEVDNLSWHLDDVSAQRHRSSAHTLSLDHLGDDLGVPRFPPTAYPWDADTIALYHLDDVPPPSQALTTVIDARDVHVTGSGHPGTPKNVTPGQPGRFRRSFRFLTAGGGSYVSVPSATDLATIGAAGSDFTVEAFIRPDRPATPPIAAPPPGCILAKKAQLNNKVKGWALAVGSFQGVPGNVRFSIADGSNYLELFAGLTVADGRFHHVAGILERRTGFSLVRLLVDGNEVARLAAPGFGVVSNHPVPLRIGLGKEMVAGVATDAQFLGLIDEVRISRVARGSFDPVLNGEGDAAYRPRLGIFERWTLPTPTAIKTAVNELVQIGGQADSFIVDEQQTVLVVGSQLMRVLPAELKPEQSISADGRLGAPEAGVVGVAGDIDFDPAWLVKFTDPAVSYGGHSAWSQMQGSVRDALAELVSHVGPTVAILAGYEPGATGLFAEGRALLIEHGTMAPGALAAWAHVSGFDYVRLEARGATYVAQARHEVFRIDVTASATATALTDAGQGDSLAVSLTPKPPRDSEVHWSLTRCGPGAAHFAGDDPHNAPGDPTHDGSQTLYADAAGDLALQVEVTRTQADGAVSTGRGNRMLRLGIKDTALTISHSISRDGARDQPEATASPTATYFDETYLVTRYEDLVSPAKPIDYGTDLMHRRMQRATSERLEQLLGILPALPATLIVERAFDPAAVQGSGHQQGRSLVLRHSSLPSRALAARAFSAGFDFVRVQTLPGGVVVVYVSVAPAELLAVSGPAQVVVGDDLTPADLSVQPQARPAGGCFLPAGDKAYVAERGSHRVTELLVTGAQNAIPRLTVSRSAWVGIEPTAICATAAAVYVANRLSSSITVLNPTAGGQLPVVTTITSDPQPSSIVTDGTAIYVASANPPPGANATVKRYLTSNNTLTATFNLLAGRQPLALAISGGKVFVTHSPAGPAGPGAFDILNAANLAPMTATITTGQAPVSAVVTANRLFVGCRDAGEVQVFATTPPYAQVVGGPIPPPYQPLSLAPSGDAKYVYVAVGPAVPMGGAGRVHIIAASPAPGLPSLLSHYVSTGADPSFVVTTPPPSGAGQPPLYNPALAIVSQEADNIAIVDPGPLSLPGGGKPPEVAEMVPLGTGAGERLQWAVDSLGPGQADLSSTSRPHVSIRTAGRQPGWVSLRVVMAMTNMLDPYNFELRLKPSLEVPQTRIEKSQYDVVMNVLNSFHPIGVEVRTGRLRQYVAELGEGLTDLLPGYTFPVFRTPRLPQLPSTDP